LYDTIIIGAGMSGLAAGIRLAHFGQRVCILERHYAPGGLNSYYRIDGRNYDVGLHAVTNFRRKGDRQGPLARLLRQLRFSWDDFGLWPQVGSRIAVPGVTLDFDNEPGHFETEIAARFPGQTDGYRRLIGDLLDYDSLYAPLARTSAREMVARRITGPLLAEMLFVPIMFYGCPGPQDLDFGSFSILFRSIFLEGLARPASGIRAILKKLLRRYKELGGELRLRAGVGRLAVTADEVDRVILDDGEELAARNILSSAGWCETLRLRDGEAENRESKIQNPKSKIENLPESGVLSFFESVSTLDVQPRDIGYRHTMVFYNDSPRLDWQRPDDLIDVRSAVICSPNNYDYGAARCDPAEGTIRITALANFDRWTALGEAEYAAAKQECYQRLVESAARFIPDFRPHAVAIDTFTPRTIRHFTGRDNGAIYGSPRKSHDGTTPLKNLFLCGTDQGLVGIIGAMNSGIMMANRLLAAQMTNAEARMSNE